MASSDGASMRAPGQDDQGQATPQLRHRAASSSGAPSTSTPPAASMLQSFKASDIHLSSADLIAVMNQVKAGNISVDEALSQVATASSAAQSSLNVSGHNHFGNDAAGESASSRNLSHVSTDTNLMASHVGTFSKQSGGSKTAAIDSVPTAAGMETFPADSRAANAVETNNDDDDDHDDVLRSTVPANIATARVRRGHCRSRSDPGVLPLEVHQLSPAMMEETASTLLQAVEPASPSWTLSSLRRITLTLNADRSRTRTVLLPPKLEQLLEVASSQLNCQAKQLLTTSGDVVNDISSIRDDDVLLVSQGEPLAPSSCRLSSTASLRSSATGSMVSLDSTEAMQTLMPAADSGDWIRLNVGGTVFRTTRSTLTRESDSMLAAMFSPDSPWSSAVDESGAFLVDRDPTYFRPLLNYLRDGVLIIDDGINPQGVLAEARFFGLQHVAAQIEPSVQERLTQRASDPPIRRHDLARLLLSTPFHATLRCQGLNFSGSDLSQLDLRNINFKFAKLRGCNLTLSNLENCNFEGADLTSAQLNGCNLMGCSLARAKLDGASLRNCNFCDPSQLTSANLEGASAKGADFEDSNLSGSIIRVASLKDASLRNCNLRCVNLAGSDLARCNLTGCNLQGANLRGANTAGAHFHNISSAVHMSQVAFGPTIAMFRRPTTTSSS